MVVLFYCRVLGIFDMFVFFGPTPDVVAKQYATVVGMPFMPPMWSLGFHLCKYGYNTSVITQSIVDRMRNASIPQVGNHAVNIHLPGKESSSRLLDSQ